MAAPVLGLDPHPVVNWRDAGHRAGLAVDHHQAIAAATDEAEPAARRAIVRVNRENAVPGSDQRARNGIGVLGRKWLAIERDLDRARHPRGPSPGPMSIHPQ